ncbi:MAG: ArsR family transcriptional regulator [Planctomycetota bacterium]|nr:MAG: ArsR family transcriptional regulator [Planctomycetota bacterium]
MPVAQESVTALLRVLADETRLRILALLNQAELAVGELARSLAMGQSRVSNHLKILREVGLIAERHQGNFTFCRLEVPGGHLGELWRALAPGIDELETRSADQARLAVVLAERSDSRAFFDRIAGDWDVLGADFAEGTGRLELLSALIQPELVVADVGCGTGYLSTALARRASRVICVDASPAMLAKASEKLGDSPAEVETRLGTLEDLPLADAEVDAACAHMVLHHLADTRTGLSEMARAVKPGGVVAAVELLPHHETWMHDAMADTRLGLDPASLQDDLRAAGFVDVQHEILSDRYVVETPSKRTVQLPLFLLRGRRPS